jgi:hypothetical protein
MIGITDWHNCKAPRTLTSTGLFWSSYALFREGGFVTLRPAFFYQNVYTSTRQFDLRNKALYILLVCDI